MRVFKISAHNLLYYQHKWDYQARAYVDKEIIPGMKVCSKTKLENVGVVTHVGPKSKRWANDEREWVTSVTVLWLTGPHKGKSVEKDTEDLSNFDAYKDSVMRHVGEIAKIEEEAARTGM